MDRIYSLDSVRFFAALIVVLYHYTAFGYNITGERIDAITPITKYGYLGVELFFMISGFVVLMSALGRTPRQYFNSRFTRVVPMFWIACLLTYGVTQLIGTPMLQTTPTNLLLNLGLVTISPLQMLAQRPWVDPVYWTLVQETMFYVLVWLALATGLIRHIRPLLYAWLGAVLLGQFLPDNTVGKILSGVLLVRYGAYFIAGGLFFLAWKERRFQPLDIMALLTCWGLAVWLGVEDAPRMAGYVGLSQEPGAITLIISAIFATFAVIASGKLPEPKFQRWAWLGALTYPLYLLHHNIGFAVINRLKLIMPGELAIGLMFVLALLMAWAAHKWLEVPFSRWVKVRLEGILPGKPAVPAKSA